MRITERDREQIKKIVHDTLGENSKVLLFGSRTDDNLRGGDVDLLIITEFPVEHPAALSAKTSAKISRIFNGRPVDVLLSSPNLKKLPIHDIAENQGIVL